MLNRRLKLPQTQEAFDSLAENFLIAHGFDNTLEYKKLFAAFVQHAPEGEDSFCPKLMAKKIRKQKANEFAFYVMYPEKRPKKEADGPEVKSATS